MKRYLLFLILITILSSLNAQVDYSRKDSLIFESLLSKLSVSRTEVSSGYLMVAVAKLFLETPYVASTLEKNENECLIVNLREFDCTTFVESCIAFTLCLKSKETSFRKFQDNLVKIRYRNSIIDGYTSRLHYMTEWIIDNEEEGIIKDMTLQLGGKIVNKRIDFMSTHPTAYKHLYNNKEIIEKVKDTELKINKDIPYSYLSKTKIESSSHLIKDGDIIVFATSIDGLDYSHIGIAYHVNDKLHFIHASSKAKKVIIETQTLADYCNNIKSCTGISVLRLKEL